MRRWLSLASLALVLLVLLVQFGSGTPEPQLRAVPITARATLKGRVTLADNPPAGLAAANAALAAQMGAHRDSATCLAAPREQQEQQAWVISAKGGVANVAVFVKAEPGSYFELTAADLKPYQEGGARHEAAMDQPYCAFVPHLLITFPSYYKDGKRTPSGQVVKIKNSSGVPHNGNWGGTRLNPGANPNIEPKSEIQIDLVPDRIACTIQCSMHAWMKGWIWALDTPFATVTDADGAFEIKDVPAGVPLRLFAWHDSGWVTEGNFAGEAVQLEAGKGLERNWQVKAGK